MPSQCEKIRKEYENLKTLKKEFDLEYQKAMETGNLTKANELRNELEAKRNALSEKLWTFEGYSLEKLKEHYGKAMDGYKEFGWLRILSSGQEGITDDQGNEHPFPPIQEIKRKLMKNTEFFAEKFALMKNPRVHLTPFALNPESMANDFDKLIESHFVEERTEGDKRIPDKNKTKLFGIDGQPLPLRTDKKNIYFSDNLKNLVYFPEWEKDANRTITAEGGMTKEEAVARIGPWRILIIEDTPKAPEKGEARETEKEIKIKGKTKKVKRKPVEGGLDTADQHKALKKMNEQGFVPEDWLSFAMLYLRENNTVLDDDKSTNYYCRLLGASSAGGNVPYAYWNRAGRRVSLGGCGPEYSGSGRGVRGAVMV